MSTDLDNPYTVLKPSTHRHQKRKLWLEILTLRWYHVGSPKYKKRVVLQPTQPQLEYPLEYPQCMLQEFKNDKVGFPIG